MHWTRFHFVAMVVWITVGGGITYFNPDSVPWVAFMSLYANIVGHFASWQGVRVEENDKNPNKK